MRNCTSQVSKLGSFGKGTPDVNNGKTGGTYHRVRTACSDIPKYLDWRRVPNPGLLLVTGAALSTGQETHAVWCSGTAAVGAVLLRARNIIDLNPQLSPSLNLSVSPFTNKF